MPLSVALVTLKQHLLGLRCSVWTCLESCGSTWIGGQHSCLQVDDTWHVSSTDTFACQKTFQVLQDVFMLLHLQGGLPLSIFQRTPHALKPLVDCTGLSCQQTYQCNSPRLHAAFQRFGGLCASTARVTASISSSQYLLHTLSKPGHPFRELSTKTLTLGTECPEEWAARMQVLHHPDAERSGLEEEEGV